MCLMALALQAHPRFPLVLASNRDEAFDRPTAPLHWWQPDATSAGGPSAVLAGRDLKAGGTWLGLSAAGRLGLVTNVRRPQPVAPQAPSRGALVPGWLAAPGGLDEHLATAGLSAVPLFNLVAADLVTGQWRWVSSESPTPRSMGPGLHALSNGQLDTPWPKTERLRAALAQALDAVDAEAHDDRGALPALQARLLAALADPAPAADAALPYTGVGLTRERWLSPVYIRSPELRYGTRCSTVLITERGPSGLRTLVIERTHEWDGRFTDRAHLLPGWPATGR